VTAPSDSRRLLLLSPSAGLGGGIERVMDAVEANWDGPLQRVDLVRARAARGADTWTAQVRPLEIASFVARAFGAARRCRPDVVVCGLLGLLPAATAVARTFRSELALLAYGVDVWGPIGPLERQLVRRCRHLLAISAFTAQAFAARARVDPRRVEILALPLADPIAAAARCAAGTHAGRAPVVLTVSRLASSDRFKGHFDIARCFGQVLEHHPAATWVVVGDGDDLPALRAECDRLGIGDAVTFKGRVSDADLIDLYRTAAVFALPSVADADADPPIGEGFGLVFLEAGAFGLPVVAATLGGGSCEFVIGGETGLTVSAHAPDEVAGAIVRLLDDPDLRTALGQRARERALARHLPAHFRTSLQRSLG
jgi:glycosyltransferase involved in cell wall biosynthesis